MERILAKRKHYTYKSAIEIVKNGTDKEKAQLASALGYDCPDYGFAQSMCIMLLQNKDKSIRVNLIKG